MYATIEQANAVQQRVTRMLSDFDNVTVDVAMDQDDLIVAVRVQDNEGLYTRLIRTGTPFQIDGVAVEVLQCRVPVYA